MLQHAVFDKTPKILLVDDNPESRSHLRKELQVAHFDTITAENGKEGLSLANMIRPDLVLVDMRTPQTDGVTVCEKLKNDPVTSDIPIILLTGKDSTEAIMAGLGLPDVDYVVRPCALEELQVRIRKVLITREEQQKLEEDLEQFKNSFVTMVSRSLYTPVMMIAGFAELLERKSDRSAPSVQRAYLQEITQQANHLVELIDDFQCLVHSRLVLEPVNLVWLVHEAVEKYQKTLEQRGYHLILNLPPDPSVIMTPGSSRHLFTAIKHLLLTIDQLTDPGGTITVTISLTEQRVRIQMACAGISSPSNLGIGPLKRYDLDDRQFARSYWGIFPGLAIAKSVAEQHHGRIGVEIKPGQDSRFWIDLPLNGISSGGSVSES